MIGPTVIAAAAKQATTLPLSEVFGPTLQGEGPHTGLPVHFIRLGQCNLACEWCDTPYTWDHSRYDVAAECPDTPLEEIVARLETLPRADAIVISGGEPLIHHHRLKDLLRAITRSTRLAHMGIHLETNGTITPPSWLGHYIDHVSVSPKIITADPAKKRLKPKALEAWANAAWSGVGQANTRPIGDTTQVTFKFVCAKATDVSTVGSLVQEYRIPREAVWIMPEGTTVEAVLEHQRALAPAVINHGYRLTTRLHTLLWHDERGH